MPLSRRLRLHNRAHGIDVRDHCGKKCAATEAIETSSDRSTVKIMASLRGKKCAAIKAIETFTSVIFRSRSFVVERSAPQLRRELGVD